MNETSTASTRPCLFSVLLAPLLLATALTAAFGQGLQSIEMATGGGLGIRSYRTVEGERINAPIGLSLFSVDLNDTLTLFSRDALVSVEKESISFSFRSGIRGALRPTPGFSRGWKGDLVLANRTQDTVSLTNLVPFGRDPYHVYIASTGPHTGIHRLSRSALFLPRRGSIGVVLPDNAWELGFGDVTCSPGRSLVGLARRSGIEGASVRRFRTILPPGSSVHYALYLDHHPGEWQRGLSVIFRDRWLYDLESFDNTLYERKDLEWIRHSYLLTIQFAWDHSYREALSGENRFDQFLTEKSHLMGVYDAFVLWPTWPRLGLDQRNQWDMYRTLPGELKGLRRQAEFANSVGTKYFISYNPWDESTRREDHLQAMRDLLRATNADGVVLDTWGASSKEFQTAADSVKSGIIMYSEGMAVPKDLPGIVAGRVHDALFMPPPLNLNKLIKPECAIFRVIQVKDGMLHREVAVSLFNGYGNEVNVMFPGRPDWIDDELAYLGRATRVLRENSAAFLSRSWTPLLPTTLDSVWVNQWPLPSKTLYTIYSLRPEGVDGPLFQVEEPREMHYVSIWNHEELDTVTRSSVSYIPASVEGFSRSWLGTRREANVDVVALFPSLLTVHLRGEALTFGAPKGSKILVWAGIPSYLHKPVEFPVDERTILLHDVLGRHEGKVVVQLFEGSELLDERIVTVPLATPRLLSSTHVSPASAGAPERMVEIPAGTFTFRTVRSFQSPNEVIPYPEYSGGASISLPRFFMDRYPVTNDEFRRFIVKTRYRPKDTTNFLRHWVRGKPPQGKGNHPIVYVSIEDARAYAAWAGKRLPSEIEWQYAAQGSDGRKYPWGNSFDSSCCNTGPGETTPVDAFPQGKSPFGVMEMVGNVWQMCNEVYDNGTNYFGMIRGGSYYNPVSSV